MIKRQSPSVKSQGIPGGSTLIMVFAVLCLTVFAILALSTVQADGRLSQRYAERVSSYYETDCLAQELIAEIRAGKIPENVEKNGNEYSFSLPITETRELTVSLTAEGENFEITDYRTQYTGTWEGEDYYTELWSGD